MEYLLFRVITSYWTNHKRGEPVLAEHCPDWGAHGETSAHLPTLPECGRRWEEMQATPSFIPFSSRKRKRDVVLQQWRPKVSSHTEPNTQHSLRAESEFQAIGCGISAASEYWFPLFPKSRKHKKLLCVLGGVQKRWNLGKEIQKVSVNPTNNITMGITEPSTAPNGILHMSIKELRDHTTKHWAKLLASVLWCGPAAYPACVTSVPVTRMPFSAAGHIEKSGFLMPTWMRWHAADIYSFPARGITELSIAHSLALHQPGWTGCVNPCVNGCQCWGRQPGAAVFPASLFLRKIGMKFMYWFFYRSPEILAFKQH